MAYTTDIRTTSTGVFGRINEFRRGFAERAGRYATYRQTMSELNVLTDRELADLGISRLQIGDIARSAAYGK
jgi:uncharacterized protein YjiS (DUF1127 family)